MARHIFADLDQGKQHLANSMDQDLHLIEVMTTGMKNVIILTYIHIRNKINNILDRGQPILQFPMPDSQRYP